MLSNIIILYTVNYWWQLSGMYSNTKEYRLYRYNIGIFSVRNQDVVYTYTLENNKTWTYNVCEISTNVQ